MYDREYWFSDKWSALDYGKEFDFSKTFAENFRSLQEVVPRFSVQQPERMENSAYCNFASNCKDCYLLFDSDFCRDSYYSDGVNKCVDCCDCSFTTEGELCYETVNCKGCYNLRYSQNCLNCFDSFFLEGCIGFSNCAFSTNLKNKQYYFRNKPLSPEEYNRTLAELQLGRFSRVRELRKDFALFASRHPQRYYQGTNNENVTGDYISNSKNVFNSYDIVEGWDLSYCDFLHRANNCLDISSFGEKIEWMYECATAGLNSHSCAFCFTSIVSCANLYYCDSAYSSKNCFGCVGLHRHDYCVLNKHYRKEEYERLISKIIDHMKDTGEWGEYFPYSLSPFAYNETVANEYYPADKESVELLGASWREMDEPAVSVEKVRIPETVEEVPESITKEQLSCAKCSKAYRITTAELRFYQRTGVPIPKECPYCRHVERMNMKSTRRLHELECNKCSAPLISTHVREAERKVLCETCYQECLE